MHKLPLAATVILVAFFLFATPVVSRWIDVDSGLRHQPPVELIESSGSGCLLEIRIPAIWVEDVEVDGQVFQKISLPEAGMMGSPGEPELPTYSCWLAIPYHSSVTAEVIEVEYKELDNFHIYPAQKPLPEMDAPEEEFLINDAFYSKDAYLPSFGAETGTPSLLRNLRIANVQAYPVQYNPARDRLKVATRMLIEVEFSGHSSLNVPRRIDTGTRTFDLLQKSFVLNYSPTVSQPGSYLIITADAFSEAIQPLAEWKNQKGYPTVVTNLSSIPPGDSASIHSHIKDAYDNWTAPPEYVLLVGDVEYLPAGMHEGIYPPPWGYYDYFGTDHCYSLVAGTDIFSDLFVGRLPVNSAAECSVLVSKILEYETSPDTSNPGWFEQSSTVGVLQSGRIFQQTCRKVREIMLAGGYAQVDTLFEGSSPPGFATPTDICDSLNDGRTFLLFRGHGAQDGWWTDGSYNILGTEHVDTLKNVGNSPVVIAPTCLANAFFDEGQECMGEAFVLQQNGSVGYFGATDVSYSFWNDSLAIGIFRGIFEEGAYHFQQGCNYGKLFMDKYFPHDDPGDGEITVQEFFFMNILGDPELPLWTDTPKPLVATHVDTIGTGSRFLYILVEAEAVPVNDALVCVMKDTETYASGYTDGSGFVELHVYPLTEGNMDVTATAMNCLPYAGQIAVINAPQPPELRAPQDGAVMADSLPQFIWTETAPDSGHYDLTLARDSMFTLDPTKVDSLQDTTYTFSAGLSDDHYFWGVEAFDVDGVGSGYQYHAFSFTVDCTPPVFSYTTAIDDTFYLGPFDIYSMITDLTGVSSPTLHYRVSPDTSWSLVLMDSCSAPDSFHAQIPAQSAEVTVDYYLSAFDFSSPANSSTDPEGAPETYFSFDILSVGVAELKRVRLPNTFALGDASPNPFLRNTQIFYQLPERCRVRIEVFDAAGRLVDCVLDRVLEPGYYSSSWDGTDSQGREVNAGVYFYRMASPSFSSSKKALLLK